MNIPDGEVFTAPVRDSVEGHVRFNTPTVYQGTSFDGVRLEFRGGRIVEADCTGGDVKKLRRIFEADEGASYVGEWSIGCNPRILHPMRDILFDEKIAGSFHLTPGQRLRRGRQRQPLEDPLGPRPDPAPRLRRRHDRLRRRADPGRRPVRARRPPGARPRVTETGEPAQTPRRNKRDGPDRLHMAGRGRIMRPFGPRKLDPDGRVPCGRTAVSCEQPEPKPQEARRGVPMALQCFAFSHQL